MSLSLDDYRCKLINKILFAGSQDEVKQVCDIAMKSLEQNKVNGLIIARIADKIIMELDKFNPLDNDAQQWSNIKVARIHLKRFKQSIIQAL